MLRQAVAGEAAARETCNPPPAVATGCRLFTGSSLRSPNEQERVAGLRCRRLRPAGLRPPFRTQAPFAGWGGRAKGASRQRDEAYGFDGCVSLFGQQPAKGKSKNGHLRVPAVPESVPGQKVRKCIAGPPAGGSTPHRARIRRRPSSRPSGGRRANRCSPGRGSALAGSAAVSGRRTRPA